MPHKHNAARRHHIPKMAHRVTNWPEYEAGLRCRGSLTLWITPGALAQWRAPRRTTRGGQPRYSDLAIETGLMVGSALRMRLRQTEGLLNSVIQLMGLPLKVPDHTTLSRRAQQRPPISRAPLPGGPLHALVDSTGVKVYGAGQWLQEKHGVKSRRRWRKLHLAVDADSGLIVAHTLTDQDADDPSQVEPLLAQIDGAIGQFTADGAYDGAPTYRSVMNHSQAAQIVVPPRATAVRSRETGSPTLRDRHLERIQHEGRLAWQAATGYGQRARVETTMGRYKGLIGARLRARHPAAQRTEAAIGIAVLNRMLSVARPKSVRSKVKSV
ncbi:transposase [Burkholderia territorii]|uniref:IS5 family transposase n=1 Tax=Burkholderia territorii TaxID=1503055 RepID=UPI00075C7CB7|nr:IS5 family transposase [Burkholderia territorii]KUY99890.1 transposase [Burkholderia territorii]KUZ14480.1 transposase [Burkholderia territorii]